MKARLRGIRLGFDDRGRGETLVLLHAFPLDRRMWEDTARDLAHAARVITLDFRGLGESEGMATIDEAADDVAALLDHLHLERAIVGGLSMGGYVALAFAERHAGRLLGLLLASTRAGADTAESKQARDEAIGRVARNGIDEYVEELVPRLLAGGNAKARGLALALAHFQQPVGVASALSSLRDRPDRTALLPLLRVPVTIVVGTEDRVTPPAEARAMAQAIEGAELVEIPGAGHLVNLEAPEAFSKAVRGLCDRVSGRVPERVSTR